MPFNFRAPPKRDNILGARSTKEDSPLQQDGELVTFEGIVLEARRSHLSVVIDTEHADALDDMRAGARLAAAGDICIVSV